MRIHTDQIKRSRARKTLKRDRYQRKPRYEYVHQETFRTHTLTGKGFVCIRPHKVLLPAYVCVKSAVRTIKFWKAVRKNLFGKRLDTQACQEDFWRLTSVHESFCTLTSVYAIVDREAFVHACLHGKLWYAHVYKESFWTHKFIWKAFVSILLLRMLSYAFVHQGKFWYAHVFKESVQGKL